MSDSYEAVEFPRGNLVIRVVDGDRANAQVVSQEITIEMAQAEAARLNAQEWLAAKPEGVPSMEWGDDWEGRLLAILDKPYQTELRAAA